MFEKKKLNLREPVNVKKRSLRRILNPTASLQVKKRSLK